MPPDFLKTVLLPLALFIIMFGMGMTLRLADFQRVLFKPKATFIGVACQLLGLPLIAFGLVHLFQLPGDLATGLMLVAICPGGPTSNIITHLSKGDTALSVTLTAVSSIVTVFTIPLLLSASMGHFLSESQMIQLPVVKTFIQLVVITLLPVALGMWLHAAKPALTQRLSGTVNVLSAVFLALVILAAVLKEKNLAEQFAAAGPAAIALNLCGMVLGYLVSKGCRLPVAQGVTIAIEVGIQNGTLALAIALGLLESPRIAMPAVCYSLFMFASGAFMIVLNGRKRAAMA